MVLGPNLSEGYTSHLNQIIRYYGLLMLGCYWIFPFYTGGNKNQIVTIKPFAHFYAFKCYGLWLTFDTNLDFEIILFLV
jgi:hypothetical protein